MKILQLTKKFPVPIKDGESLAIISMSKSLSGQDCKIDLFAINTFKHNSDAKLDHHDLTHYKNIQTVSLDTEINYVSAFKHLVTRRSYNLSRFYKKSISNELIQMLKTKSYDIILFETLYMTIYLDDIKRHCDAKLVLRSHNLEYEIWQNLAHYSEGIKKVYFKACAKGLLKHELNQFDKLDLLIPISETDSIKYEKLGYSGVRETIPVGVELISNKQDKDIRSQIKRIGYIGSLDWKPNLEGLNWFFDKIWNKILQAYPDVEFHLAGRNLEKDNPIVRQKNLVYHGEIEDAQAFIADLDIILVPLMSGSGIRVKILESMSLGKLVMATDKALEGIPVENGKHALVFNNASESIQSLGIVYTNVEKRKLIEENAQKLILKHFDKTMLAAKLKNKFLAILN